MSKGLMMERNSERPTTSRPLRSTTITIRGAWAYLEPKLMDSVVLSLGYFTHSFSQSTSPQAPFTKQTKTLLHRLPDGRLQIPVGCIGIITRRLEQLGYDVTIDDRRTFGVHCQHNPQSRLLREIAKDDNDFLERADEAHRGLIDVREFEDIVRLTSLLLRYYNQARKLVLVPSRNARDKFYRELLRFSNVQIDSDHIQAIIPKSGSLVRTYPEIVNPDDWDVIIHTDAECAVAPSRREDWMMFGQHKMFGFLPRGMPDHTQLQLLLHQACGSVIYPCTEPRAFVRVLWCESPTYEPSGKSQAALHRKRTGYWHNEPRNQRIAEAAQAVAAGDVETLWRWGMLLGEEGNSPILPDSPRVAILVESPEHGREIKRFLPGWRLLQQNDRLAWTGPDKVILTLIKAKSLRTLECDVLIRADGTEWPLKLEGFPRKGSGEQLLIDLADDFDEPAWVATNRRAIEYALRGWPFDNTPNCLR